MDFQGKRISYRFYKQDLLLELIAKFLQFSKARFVLLQFLQARFALRIDHQSEKGGNLKGHFGRKQFCCNFNCHYTHGAKMLTKIGELFDFAYFSTSSKPDCGEENLATE